MKARNIEIVCHRGANEFAPENTYASAQKCIDWGVDYVEIDINTSADGVLYLMHGPSLEKTTNGEGVIMEQSAAYIDSLDAGSWFDPKFAGESVPRLDQFLVWIKGKAKLFLDVKWCDLSQLVTLIRQHEMDDQCFFWFGIPELATEFRQIAPDLQLKVNAKSREDILQAYRDLDANIIECGYPISAETMTTCQQLGLKLMVNYLGNDESIYRDIIRQQPAMINLDFADRFIRVLEELN